MQITPEEALNKRESISTREDYYCPNPNCDARLIPVSGDEHRKPFFRARKDAKHSMVCDFKSYERDTDVIPLKNPKFTGLYPDDFSIDTFYQYMMEDKAPKNTESAGKSFGPLDRIEKIEENKAQKNQFQPIKNLKKLYEYCISHDINDNLGSQAIKNLILDERTIKDTYKKFIPNGKIMILNLPICSFSYNKDNPNFQFSLAVDISENKRKEYRFKIDVLNSQYFWDLEDRIYKQKNNTKARFILVAKINKHISKNQLYTCSLEKPEQCYITEK